MSAETALTCHGFAHDRMVVETRLLRLDSDRVISVPNASSQRSVRRCISDQRSLSLPS